jgi:hypothetical protein
MPTKKIKKHSSCRNEIDMMGFFFFFENVISMIDCNRKDQRTWINGDLKTLGAALVIGLI